ncbi:hypothetical protein Trydic_g23651 [Trypoxylus dichotomus]
MTKSLKKEKQKKKNGQVAGVTYVVVPPDGGWGWVIVLASFICNFVAEGTMYSYGLLLEDIAIGLQTTTTNVSLANSLMTGFYFLFGTLPVMTPILYLVCLRFFFLNIYKLFVFSRQYYEKSRI